MYKKPFVAWVLFIPFAIANGMVRDMVYSRWFEESAAHQVSTLILIALFFGYVFIFLGNTFAAYETKKLFFIGLFWVVLTILFELFFGFFIEKASISRLIAEYNTLNGNIWDLFLIFQLVCPILVKAMYTKLKGRPFLARELILP